MKKINTTPIKFWTATIILLSFTITIIPELGFLFIIAWLGGMVTSIRKFNQLGINNFLCTIFSMILTGFALIVVWIKILKHNKNLEYSEELKTPVASFD